MPDTRESFIAELDDIAASVSSENPDVKHDYDELDDVITRLGNITHRRPVPA